MTALPSNCTRAGALDRPRLGFLGVGWIGRRRMKALAEADVGEIAAIAEPSPEMVQAARAVAPEAEIVAGLDELIAAGIDGVVIATPSALHAGQAIAAFENGLAVFCQKPLGRTAQETASVAKAARAADRLLAVDMCYRFTEAMRTIRDLVAAGELGRVFAVDLVFHNAYGPDKSWFYDAALSGGGCVMDLGVHLVDLALWALGFPAVAHVSSTLLSKGEPLKPDSREVEDYALATLRLETGTVVQLSCSWNLPAGRNAVIGASFYGMKGGAGLHNVDGSFFDFLAERFDGTAHKTLSAPPDDWGGRAVVDWVKRLAAGARYDAEVEQLVAVAHTLDRIYGRQGEAKP